MPKNYFELQPKTKENNNVEKKTFFKCQRGRRPLNFLVAC